MSEQADRPANLRRPPRPAADERVDPVDYRAPAAKTAAPAPAPAPAPSPASTVDVPAPARRGRPRRELTAQFSTRLTPDVIELIDQAASQEGTTIRDVVEQAIRRTWGGPTSSA